MPENYTEKVSYLLMKIAIKGISWKHELEVIMYNGMQNIHER